MALLIYLGFDIKANPDWDLNWSLLTLAVALLGLHGFFLRFEDRKPSSKEIALLAILSALAALVRLPFAAIPSVQPTTFLVIISGFVFGPGAGFMVGALAALISDFFLGMGPWVPWQMVAWGLAGAAAGFLGRWQKNFSRFLLVLFAAAWGYLYGVIMNTWHWLTFVYPLTWQTFAATYAVAFWFDTFHSIGNGIFMWFMGRDLIKVLERFNKRLLVKRVIDANGDC